MKFGTRFQTLYEGNLNRNTDDYDDKLLVKRTRLKFDGFVFNPNLTYKIQLGLTNRDIRASQIAQSGNTAGIIYDAVLKWEFAKNWELWFGQAKLPGNRERVISSQKLQFVDRSLVNSRFNIDRGSGIQLRHKNKIGKFVVRKFFPSTWWKEGILQQTMLVVMIILVELKFYLWENLLGKGIISVLTLNENLLPSY
jgi:hypothetical protein